MPAWRAGGDGPAYYALKEVCVFPDNPKRGLDTHLGAVILHSGDTGEPLAFMNASAITAIRTAAVSAVATRLLAREDAGVLAIIGTGVQGRSHRRAIPLVREIREIRMCGRGESVEEAVRGADIIVTATSSREPILRREWLSPGVHINAVGSSIAAARELEADLVAAASLFVDRRESTVSESGDYLAAVEQGAVIRAELGELLTGAAEGRKSEEEITLFKSLGLAVEDLAAAAFLYESARREGAGTWVEF
jgi:ornithine cyclodeaminase